MPPEATSPQQRVFGITGWKNAGKTTLLAGLVTELTRRGLAVSTVKHAHHSFEVDEEGRDSWRHRQAGAQQTAIVSSTRWALMRELRNDAEPPLPEMLEKLDPCDLVLIEGYKREAHPKLELVRGDSAGDRPRWPDDASIVAIAAAERPEDCPLPVFSPDDVPAIADFVLAFLGLPVHSDDDERNHATG